MIKLTIALTAILLTTQVSYAQTRVNGIQTPQFTQQQNKDASDFIRRRLDNAHQKGQKVVTIPAGVYTISKPLPIYNNMTIRGAGANKTILKNSDSNGPKIMFSTEVAGTETPKNITIENIGFDSNGFNRDSFLAVIVITGKSFNAQASNIRIRNNRFFDSVFDRQNPSTQLNCDRGLKTCEQKVKQRQYIVALNVDGLWVTDNKLSGGGRIKIGRPGRNIYIRRNTLNFVNDNAITFVNNGGNCKASKTFCFTENVFITDNVIHNPVNNGIFFGADGEDFDHPAITMKNVVIARNKITGFFDKGIFAILPAKTNGVKIFANTVMASRQRPLINGTGQNPVGIMLKNSGRQSTINAKNVLIQNNTIGIGNRNGVYQLAALSVGNISNLKVLNNQIKTNFPGTISRGLRISSTLNNARFAGNKVTHASNAMSILGSLQNTVFDSNHFLKSLDSSWGQIRIELQGSEKVNASFLNNKIQDGAGYGISCQGTNASKLTFTGNTVSGNKRGPSLGCPVK